MVSERSRRFDGKPLEKVADIMSNGLPGSSNELIVKAEFLYRQTQAIIETAEATKKYTRYMFCTVCIMAVTLIINLIFQFIQ